MAFYSQNSFFKALVGAYNWLAACTLYVICEGPLHSVSISEKRRQTTKVMNSEGKGLNCVVFLRFQPVVLSLSDDVKCSLMSELGSKDVQFVRITAHKPQYEVGSSSQLILSFGKNKTGEISFILLFPYFLTLEATFIIC